MYFHNNESCTVFCTCCYWVSPSLMRLNGGFSAYQQLKLNIVDITDWIFIVFHDISVLRYAELKVSCFRRILPNCE